MIELSSYKMQYLEEMYEQLTHLDKKHGEVLSTFLVKNRQTGKIAVAKYVDISVLPVYEKIEQISSRHLEKIYHCAGGKSQNVSGVEACGLVITEYISGMSLREHMERSGLLQEMEVCHIIAQLLEVLQIIHKEGIIHRDINPDNIMISGDGVLKLIDFGIAREKKLGKNQDTTILGTVGYAAPEQFGFLQTDERTDIYAVGVLMNKMLTGYFPVEKLYAKEPMRTVISRCTAMDLGMRYGNAEELSEVLKEIQGVKEKKQEDGVAKEREALKTISYENILECLPGFRTGVVWKQVVATVGYCMMLIYSVASIVECMATWQTTVLEATAIFIYIWAATLIVANIANWDRRVPICRDTPKPAMIVIRVFLWIIIFYAGIMLENYVRYDILGISKI